MNFNAQVDRVRSEFVEMPGMQLTPAPATRLWNLGPDDCRSVIARSSMRLSDVNVAPEGDAQRSRSRPNSSLPTFLSAPRADWTFRRTAVPGSARVTFPSMVPASQELRAHGQADGPLFDSTLGARSTRCRRRCRARPQYRGLLDELATATPSSCIAIRSRPTALSHQAITFTSTATIAQPSASSRRLLPRIITAREWATLEQADQASDRHQPVPENVYHDAGSCRGVVPRDLVYRCRHTGARCAASTSIATSTSRSPAPTSSGSTTASSSSRGQPARAERRVDMLANREVTNPCSRGCSIAITSSVAHYGQALLATLRALAPPAVGSDLRRADAGGRQLCLLRACLPRPRDGVALSRGATCSSTTTSSTCGPRPGCTGRRDLCRVDVTSSTRCVPARLHSASPACSSLPCRQRLAGQRDRHRHADDKALYATCRRSSSSTSRSVRSSRTCNVSSVTRRSGLCARDLDQLVIRPSANGRLGMLIGPTDGQGTRAVSRFDSG